MKRPVFLTLALTSLLAALSSPLARGAEPARPFEVIFTPTILYSYADVWAFTPATNAPVIPPVSQIMRGQGARFLVFFIGPKVDAENRADVTFDFSMTRPDGSIYHEKAGIPGVPATKVDPKSVLLAQNTISFSAEAKDPLGEYKIRIVAHDRIGRATAETRASFSVVAPETINHSLPVGFDMGEWLVGYFRNPEPHLALPALLATSEDPKLTGKTAEEHGATLGFFEQILRDNPWLVPRFVAQITETSGEKQRLLSLVLTFAFRDEPKFFGQLSTEQRRIVREHSQGSFPIPRPEPVRAAQLDVLWGNFFASGNIGPVKQLVAVLRYFPHRAELDKFSKLAVKPTPTPPEVLKSAVFGAAVWSIGANAKQFPLVRDYCIYLVERGDLDTDARNALAAILKAVLEGPPAAAPTTDAPVEKKPE